MLKKENLSDKLSTILGEKIIYNELKPGEIIYETQIAKEWGVSRSPVRDALRMLEQNRLVERIPKGNYRVTDFSPSSIQSSYEAIDIMFRYAFAKAAENADKHILKSLKEALDMIEKSIPNQDVKQYLAGTVNFGTVILKASKNPIVTKMALELMPTAQRIQWAALTYKPENLEKVVHYVSESYKNICNGNSESASKNFGRFALIHVTAASEYLLSQDQDPPPVQTR